MFIRLLPFFMKVLMRKLKFDDLREIQDPRNVQLTVELPM